MRSLGGSAAAFALLLATGTAQAQQANPGDTAVALPIKPDRTISFDTDEGTWISLDASPDGRSIAFDLVGDLYILPMNGGEARRITSGMAWDCMPRFSPDGRSIAFISDRSGSDNLWIVNIDGSGLRQVTKETDFALSSPEWVPDGDYIVARKFGAYPGPVDYLRSVPLWLYHKDGGSGTELFPGPGNTGLTTNTGAAFSPDGRYMYFSSHAGGYSGESVNQYQVVRFDRTTGDRQTLTSGYGGGLRPIISPDGRWLVYATRADTRTALRIRDLARQEDRWLVAEMQRDDQEGYAPNDILPGYSFTSDSRAVVFTGGGKIKRVDITTRDVSIIPFRARVEQGVASRHRVALRIDDEPMSVRQLIGVQPSPDGRRLAFSAVGRLWITEIGGTPRRLTDANVREYQPAFSPDGQWIAYVTWTDSAGGNVWKVRVDGGAPVQLTRQSGYYQSPIWSGDGDRVVFNAASIRAGQGAPNAGVGELRWVSANGGDARTILTGGRIPVMVTRGGDSARVFFTEGVPGSGPMATPSTNLVSVRFDGQERRVHVRITSQSGGGPSAIPSPDQRSLFVLDRDDAYVMAMTPAGAQGLAINLGSPSVPLRRITTEGANYIAWMDGGRTLAWSFANRFHRASLDRVMASDQRTSWGIDTTEIELRVARARPQGMLVLRGARIITMRGEEVIERGDILIENNRIRQVGAQVTAPAGARVIDVAGATIIPGLVDVHAHPRVGREIANDQEWSIAINLAYGVTTTRNPSGSRGSFPWGELVEAGAMIGSRVYATGPPLTSNVVPVRSYEDALNAVRRYKAQGANSLKQYLQPRRIQRQWFLQAARAENMNITNEGAGDLKADVTMAIDGYTAFEHTLPVVPIYKDLVQIFAQTGITYTPAMIASYGGPSSQDYWRAAWDMHGDAKLRRFTPHPELDSYGRRRPLIVEEDFIFSKIAAGARDILRAGGRVGMGSHGNQQGLGAQWELWNLASGGMTPMEVLRVSTIIGAESIGFDRDVGSIEPGKLADLVVLDANPLDDIRNTNRIRYVVKNGVVYDGNTLDEVWPRARPFPIPWWLAEDAELERLNGRTGGS
jgi:Tol biopolymer transport system component/imidazolonepropionase-like amidohydrolase